MPNFFIDRPVFAWVVALFILLAGALSIPRLPVAQYPAVAPPSVSIYAAYPGASAQLIDDSVTSLIETELNGADGLLYFESQSDVSGSAQITATFAPGTDPQMAQMDVQNRLKKVEARLPQAIKQQGLFIESSSSSFLLLVTLSSVDGHLDEIALGDYLTRNVINEIKRIPGVGRVASFSSERAMRIWIDPVRLMSFNLSTADIAAAIAEQNAQIATGKIGDLPNTPNQRIVATVTAHGQLNTPEEFGAIVLRAKTDGSSVRLRDVATVEMGAQTFQYATRLNGKPTTAFAVQLAPDGNALATATAIREKMQELSRFFPEGVVHDIPYDTSPFVKISIQQVVETLLEAVVLVFLVVYLFLQNLRYTLIPTIVVPIALAGSFAVMLALDYSINVLTLFGMVLAIGILVDDAIVVVENVERIMTEEGLPPKAATRKAMGQITGAIIGITLVLVAVFIPMAFMSGSVGAIYRQFAVAMASSILFSALLALSLTPALCATLLKPVTGHSGATARRGPLAGFNRLFERIAALYNRGVAHVLQRALRYGLIYLALLATLGFLYAHLPSSFLPIEDQGYLNVDVQLPADATMSRTTTAVEHMERHFSQRAAVQDVVTLLGTGFSGNGQNTALAFVTFRDWSERGPDQSAEAEAEQANIALSGLRDGLAYAVVAPPIDGLGNSSGFALRLQDRGGLGHDALLAARDQLLASAANSKLLRDVRSEALEDGAQLQLRIDREKAAALGVSFAAIGDTLSVALGSAYVNDFPNGGHLQQVIVQAEAAARMQPEDLLRLHARNSDGAMVPFSAFAELVWQKGPLQLTRYNGYPALRIAGDSAPGFSSGAAMAELERLLAQLPPGFGYEWSGQSLQERISGMQVPVLLGLSLLVVFLVLAALYESWSIPFSALLVVPLGMIGAVLAVMLRGLPNDVFFKVGLITIIGLSVKNAVLIIEYARDAQARGDDPVRAVRAAARLRFRPIVMTSLAFIFGVLPLALADGAGAPSQRAIGTGVLGGMISATVLAVFWVPLFYVWVRRLFSGRRAANDNAAALEAG